MALSTSTSLSSSSSPSSSFVNALSSAISPSCSVCGDRSTGKHYGVNSCDGCKGFFRRSVNKNQIYTCRFNRDCVVTIDKRNHCRYCRLKKCFKVGMLKEAVKNENEKSGRRKLSVVDSVVGMNSINMKILIDTDVKSRRGSIPVDPTEDQKDLILSKKIATFPDVCDSMKIHLLIMVEWARGIPSFCSLRLEDQMALLRAHAGEHLILGLARRSRHLKDLLLLGNDKILMGDAANVGYISYRIMNELCKPFRELDINDTEFACIKAMSFFDPYAKGLIDPEKIKEIRLHVQLLLEDYISERKEYGRGRFGQILLTFPAIQSISWQMIEHIHCAKVFGIARIDNLLDEMLLGDYFSSLSISEAQIEACRDILLTENENANSSN